MTETRTEARLATGGTSGEDRAKKVWRRRLAPRMRPETEAQVVARLEALIAPLGEAVVDSWLQGLVLEADRKGPKDPAAWLWSRVSRGHPPTKAAPRPASTEAAALVKRQLARHVPARRRPVLERRVDALFERFGEAHTGRWVAEIGREANDASVKDPAGFVFQKIVNEDPPVELDPTEAASAAPKLTNGERLARTTKEWREQVREGVLGDLAQRVMDLAGAPPAPRRDAHKPLSPEWSKAWIAWKSERCDWEREHAAASHRRAEELYARAARELEDEGTPPLPVLVGERAHALLERR